MRFGEWALKEKEEVGEELELAVFVVVKINSITPPRRDEEHPIRP